MATCGLSAPPPNATSCGGVGARRWWTKRWATAFSGVLVSDFYAAYHHYDGPKQRCWAHLLRDIHDQRTRYTKDAALARWAAAVHQLYVAAKACNHHEPWQRRVAQLAWERKLLAICRPFLSDPSVVQGKLCRRIERFIKETLRLRGRTGRAVGQQPRRTQPAPPGHQSQDQRQHPLGAGHREQDDAGIHLRHLARPGSKSSRRLPSTAHFPATLNCYPEPPMEHRYANNSNLSIDVEHTI